MGPRNAQEFASQLSPDGSAVLVQKDPATFIILQLPSLKVNPALACISCELHVAGQMAAFPLGIYH